MADDPTPKYAVVRASSADQLYRLHQRYVHSALDEMSNQFVRRSHSLQYDVNVDDRSEHTDGRHARSASTAIRTLHRIAENENEDECGDWIRLSTEGNQTMQSLLRSSQGFRFVDYAKKSGLFDAMGNTGALT
ncbi:hypothetical protein Tcan_14470 [Toxocara canis]|uniref:Uncharacterized protein n=1 Tax=Toxocara canis TaxID=6265 RepID=A0A0B2VCB8_TOXCA|nr:hypothetical protein Tcan_14470 [Toxocara canis]